MYQRARPRSPEAIDKPYLFVRLPLEVDADSLLRELETQELSFMPSAWKWHLETRFCILRSGPDLHYAGSGLLAGEASDTEVLSRLPAVRAFLEQQLPVRPARAWLGLSPPGARIFLHTDNTSHWDCHHRLHVPLKTDPGARLCTGGRFAHLPANAAWLFNNSLPHGMLNRGAERLHLILDLPPNAAMADWLAQGTSLAGEVDADAYAELSQNPLNSLQPHDLTDLEQLRRLLEQ